MQSSNLSTRHDPAAGPLVTRQDLLAGFTRLGLRAGDTVLVHSSLSRFGHVQGGADAVIDALIEILGSGGTLMMSAITTNTAFVIACIQAAEQDVIAPVDPFDVAGAKTYAGTIAETFRRRPGVLRSRHPTHSVSATGARAEALIAHHENAPGPCGIETPYARLFDLARGFVLLLGVNHMSNTALHGIEELANLDYILYPKWVRIPIRNSSGQQLARTRVHNAFMGRNLGILETQYIDGLAQAVTHIGRSYVRLVNAGLMRDITLKAFAADPHCMLNSRGVKAFAIMSQTGNFTADPLAGVPR